MYRQLNRIRTSLSALSKQQSSWTQGDGPNYSKNVIAIGTATAAGVLIAMLYHRWKFEKEISDIE